MQTDFLSQLAENIGALFGSHCEVVIHDFTKGFDETVVKIVNGHVSGRSEGACPTSRLFDSYQALDDLEQQNSSVYFTTTEDGRILKSCTTIIRDYMGRASGAVCINYDITDLVAQQQSLEQFINFPASTGMQNETHYQNVNDLLKHYLSLAEELVGKPAKEMDKQERMRALAFLNERGIFQISKAHVTLCDFFGISKYTLYTCLDEIKKHNSIPNILAEKKG